MRISDLSSDVCSSDLIAAAAHQAFSANLYTLPADVFPRAAVGSVIGIGGPAGAIGGMLMAKYAGFVLDHLGTYTPLFAVAGRAYFIALIAVPLLSPRLEPVPVARCTPLCRSVERRVGKECFSSCKSWLSLS